MQFLTTPTKILLFAAAVLVITNNATAASLCSHFQQPCLESNGNLVLGDQDRASKIAEIMDQSAETYERYFSMKPAKVAIVNGGTIAPKLHEKLTTLGFETILPWIKQSDRDNLAIASVRRQVEEQTQGMPDALRESIIAQAIAQLDTSGDAGTSTNIDHTEAGALTHELGHLWFMKQFTSATESAENNAEHGYGGWAPDWLDETAAVLMENTQLTKSRQESFAKTSNADLIPLNDFLTMEHPVYRAALALAEKSSNDSEGAESGAAKAIILTGDEADEFLASAGGDPTQFYQQVRAFADFMIEQYEDKQVFEKIARHLSNGETFEDWLSKTPDNGQPKTLKQLDTLWQAWIPSQQQAT